MLGKPRPGIAPGYEGELEDMWPAFAVSGDLAFSAASIADGFAAAGAGEGGNMPCC